MPVRLYELIGRAVRDRREDLELTQAQLAEATGIKRSSISNLEIGKQKVPLEQLIRIARALSCDYKDLLPPSDEAMGSTTGPLLADNLEEHAPATARFIEQLSGDSGKRRRRRKR